jgi:hypothetical protein
MRVWSELQRMNDLVKRTCEVITTDNAIIYNPSVYLGITNCHSVVCGAPAYDFVDYGNKKVWLCLKHWVDSNARNYPTRTHPPDFESW